MSKDHVRITLRIPQDLHEKLSISADDGTRSLNNEIIKRLEGSYLEEMERMSAEEFLRKLIREELSKQ